MRKNIYRIILVISLVLIVVAAVNIVILSREYRAGINEYKALEQYVEVVDSTKPVQKAETEEIQEEVVKESVIPVSLQIDYAQLKAINEDFVGWIYYEPWSYPIRLSGVMITNTIPIILLKMRITAQVLFSWIF